VGEHDTFVGKASAQGMRHSLSVAKIAHAIILCLNETEVPEACVTGPLVWAKGDGRHDAFTIPKRAQAAGCIDQSKDCLQDKQVSTISNTLSLVGSALV
jgi:hypothetical protein